MWFKKNKAQDVPESIPPKLKRQSKSLRDGSLKRDLDSVRKNTSRFGMGVGNHNINGIIRNVLESARDISRELTLNNPVAKRYISLTADAVCGADGITIRPDVLNSDGTTNTVLSDQLEKLFYRWAEDPERFSLDGKISIDLFQSLIEKTRARDGEVFIRIHKGNGKDLKIEIVDGARLPTTKNERKATSYISNSIEFDMNGKVIAYHVCRYNPNTYQIDQGKFEVIPASEMIHYYVLEFPGMERGLPDLFAGTKVLNELNQYYEATLVSKRVSASTMAFITNTNNDDIDLSEGADTPIYTQYLEAGMISELQAGQDIKTVTPQAGVDRIGEFTDNILTLVSMSLGVTKQNLTGDTSGASFSASKLSDKLQQSAMKTRSNVLISRVLKRIYSVWLANEMINNNRLNLSFADFDDLVSARYILPKSVSIDPVRDAQEQQMYLDMGVKSKSQVIHEMGQDPATVFAEITLEKEKEYNNITGDSNGIESKEKTNAGDESIN
ncbi:phage portal protein [Serratia liquefaciens]|uniref:phage portal protein n=1 Tax=Serratia liquefaciens TaxID=614 RepID=UPI002178679B|nr:phage portal protein [Serratia liquefaciens]CAI1685655.1 phage portal protein, lambda family [Serratia liquefaciens]